MKKKSLIVVTSSALAAMAIVGMTFVAGGKFQAVYGDTSLGNHYSEIAPGDYTPGVYEYYANCSTHEKTVITYSDAGGGYTVQNANANSRSGISGLNGAASYGINGNTFNGWSHDCGYIAFTNAITVSAGAKLKVNLTITCSSPLSNNVSFYPLSADGKDWGANRLDLAAAASASGATSTVTIPLDGTPSFGTSVSGFFFATPLISYYNVKTSSVSESACTVTINSVKISSAAPSGTWTAATLADDVKNTILADSTDSRYEPGLLGTKSAISAYTCENGTDSTVSRTCPSGLVGTVRSSLSGHTFGFWEQDCGYVNFTSPLTVTTGSKLEISLTVSCSADPVGTKISFYPLSAGGLSWGSNRVDLTAPAGATTTVVLPLTDTPSFISGTTVPGFFISAVLVNYWNVLTESARTGTSASVTVNSISLLLNFN